MKLTAFFSTLLLFLCLPALLLHNVALAAKFSQAQVRFDRMKADSPLSGLICAAPSASGAGTESRVQITFPSDFTLDTDIASWTTGTSDIPSGTTAWPGIGSTATQLSGQTVTFATSNLTTTNRYCFTFSGSGSTTGNAGQKTGTLTTRESDNTLIDQTGYGVTITANDQVTLTATVPAKPSDFEAEIRRLDPGTVFTEGSELEYEISYGSNLSHATNMSVEASWSLGTISGSGTPSVEVVEYVIGSGTNAYNNSPPVVDLDNRTITWTITPSFPGNTHGQKVRFKLKTTNNYTGTSLVSFTVSGRVLGPATATPYNTNTTYYQYSSFAPTPVPGTGPTTPPTSVTPTQTPTAREGVRFQTVDLRSVSSDEGVMDVTLSRPASLSISYGTDPRRLNERLTSLNRAVRHTLRLTALSPDTPYYFRITATDEIGNRITSDIFTFTTARESDPPKIAKDTLIATSNNTILFSPLYRKRTGDKNLVIIPRNMIFDTQFGMEQGLDIRDIRLIVRGKRVLGINNITGDVAAAESAPTLEIKPGIFSSRLKSNATPGEYEIYARVSDYNNNIVEEKIADLRVVKPLLVYLNKNNTPVENAKVTLSLYNERTRTYDFISPQMLAIKNPNYSEPDGSVPVVLPAGTYRAEVEEVRNGKKTADFTIGPGSSEEYPTIYLDTAPFSFIKTIQHLVTTGTDIIHLSRDYLNRLGTSGRFFELNSLIILGCFVILSLFALAGRLRIPITHLPWYFSHLLFLHHTKEHLKSTLLKGVVIDSRTEKAVSGADVYVMDKASGEILLRTVTNSSGKFSFPVLPIFTYTMEIAKPLYHEGRFTVHESYGTKERTYILSHHGSLPSITEKLPMLVEETLSLAFELILFISFFLLIILGLSFGWFTVLPFFVLAGFNLLFWILHLRHNALYKSI